MSWRPFVVLVTWYQTQDAIRVSISGGDVSAL